MKKYYEEVSILIFNLEMKDVVTASGDWTGGQWTDENGDHGKDWYW